MKMALFYVFQRVFICFGMVFGVVASATAQGTVEDVQQFIAEHPDALVLFYRPGCPYSRHVLPLFDAVQKKKSGVAFLKVDVTSGNNAFKTAFGFSTGPTFIYFKGGQEQKRHDSNNKSLKMKDIENNLQRIYF